MRLVGLHAGGKLRDQRLLRVHLLLRCRVFANQAHIALQVAARVHELGLVLGALGLRLRQLRLQRTRVNARQHLAGLHVLTLGKANLVELAINARLDRDALRGSHCAYAHLIQGHGLLQHCCQGDLHRWR